MIEIENLHHRAQEYPECQRRGCSVTTLTPHVNPDMDPDDPTIGDAYWALYHRCGDRYGLVPVAPGLTDEPELFYHALDIAHEAMDHLGEKPA